ncbi:AAA family ATPase [Sorangium sp. So ce204]|uniref:AAA family ATPase n=1 Tax=Sorangium sp. So ce204 TaxID=3133288 RepID=UPI003F62DE88
MPITELHIEGLRTIQNVHLRLNGLTVLIGDNGSGKSSILEACEILRRTTGPRFLDEFHGIHGGLTALLRQGAKRLSIGLTITPRAGRAKLGDIESIMTDTYELVKYELTLVPTGPFASVHERVSAKFTPQGRRHVTSMGARRKRARSVNEGASGAENLEILFEHEGDNFVFFADRAKWYTSGPEDGRNPFLAELNYGSSDDSYGDIVWTTLHFIGSHLKNFSIHLPFETTPAWAARALDRKSALRSSALLTPADHLEKLGINLASAYHALKNRFGRDHWDKTLEYLRLGLGERIEDVVTWADPGGGNIGLSLKLVGLDLAIPAAQLSDGMLSYLAFVALFRLHTTKPSLVTFDEPDLHLHPHLLMRVLDIFESMARDCPVLLATHSDRLLDGLRDPANSVVLCELDEHGATRLVRPDRHMLERWLERYRGLGDIRAAGHAASVLTKAELS